MYANSVLSSNDLCVKIKYCNSFKWTNQAEIEAKKNCPLGSQEKSKANSLHGRLLWCDYVKIIKTVSSPSYIYTYIHILRYVMFPNSSAALIDTDLR